MWPRGVLPSEELGTQEVGWGCPAEGGQTREAWGREGLRLVKASVAWSSGPCCLCPARIISNFVFGF